MTAADITLIITTYNRCDSLLLVLQALAQQSVQGFKVVVADDGSTADTRQQLEQLQQLPYAIDYVWQSDLGFRAAKIRNLALHHSHSDYIIFLDGDSVPRINFIANHLNLAERGYFVAGQRILCSQKATATIIEQTQPLWAFSWWQWLWAYCRRDINHISGLLTLADNHWRKKNQRWQGAMTSNLAVWRDDLLAINGFEQQYRGWGHEDADLVVRLLRHACQRKSGRCATAILHLWHKENDRSQIEANQQRLQQLLNSDKQNATQGYQVDK